MRQLLDAYDAHNPQTNAVLKKLFLDKLPPEVRGILAASLETNLDSLATRADEVIAALAQNQFSQRPSTSQQLINQLFDQKLNKIIDQLQNSTPSQNFNLRPRQEQKSFASHSRPPPRRRYTNPRNTYSNSCGQRSNFLAGSEVILDVLASNILQLSLLQQTYCLCCLFLSFCLNCVMYVCKYIFLRLANL